MITAARATEVAALLRDASRAEILPRFRRLAQGAVRAKSGPLDLVTDADEAAERIIEAGLTRLFPGCAVVGEEARRNAEALEALGMRPAMRARWAALQQRALDQQTIASDASGGYGAVTRVVRLLVQSGILALGAYLAILKQISPGAMIAGSIIMSRALAPVEQAVGNWQQFVAFRRARERLQGTPR